MLRAALRGVLPDCVAMPSQVLRIASNDGSYLVID